jgi:hypothetical protein
LYVPSGINTRALLGRQAKHADKYNYLLHYLTTARSIDKRLTSESYVPVSARILDKYLTTRHAPQVLKFWVEAGVIEREPVATGKTGYIVGKKSISYRFTQAYRQAKIVDAGYLDEKFEAKIAQLTKEFRLGKMDTTVKANAFLLFNVFELRINAVAAHQMVNERLAMGRITLEKADIATTRIQAIKEGDWFHKRDSIAGRFHHNLASLNKWLRPACYIETGETLVNLDITNSQPVILSILLRQHFGAPAPADVQEYIHLCETGKFYEHLAAKLGVDISTEDLRSKFKQMLFRTIFYGRNQAAENYQEWHLFTRFFPAVATFITNYKRKDYTALSVNLQRLEAEIMIDGVINTIALQYNPEDFFALTIHDSIVTTEDKKDYVKALIAQEFRKRGIRANISEQPIN